MTTTAASTEGAVLTGTVTSAPDVVVGARTFRVERTGTPNVPYALVGPRGGRTLLARKSSRPTLLFAVGNGVLRGRWFDEAPDGTLRAR
jgi:hypothetical protein